MTERGAHTPQGLAGEARRALVEWVREGGEHGREFLQVHLRATDTGRFAVRHLEDRQRPAAELELLADPFRARTVAQTTSDGAHRPLKTAPNLRRGWRFEALDERGLWTVLDYLYPACVNHWYAERTGSLRVTHWQETSARQSGIYSSVKLLPVAAVADVVQACCADAVCLRRVAWGISPDHPQPIPSEGALPAHPPTAGERVPCPEACSIFISLARAVLQTERVPRAPVRGLGELNDVELQQIRDLVEAAAGGTYDAPREGEFELPLNQRRLRYLALRLRRSAPEGGSEPAGS